jgi:hypothetical protein
MLYIILIYNIYVIKKIRLMIKNFTQFNEELSPQLLRRAAVAAYGATNSQGALTPQTKRGDNFRAAAVDTERKEIDSKKKENYEAFMKLTGGFLLGYECIVDPLRVNPGGDTWIEIRGVFKTKKGTADRIFITENGGLVMSAIINGNSGKSENAIDLKDIFVDRKDARVYAKFLNWWNGTDIAFNKNDYCINNIHI